MTTTPNQDLPKINGITAKIGTAERRLAHLERRLDLRTNEYANGASADYDRAEMAMLKSAVACMRAHQAVVDSFGVLIYRNSGSDLATDIKAMLSPAELRRLRESLDQ